jgi:hypothetical protein
MNPLDAIKTALEALCLRAGVSADDGGSLAAATVRRFLCAYAPDADRSCPLSCAVARFLKAQTKIDGVPYLGEAYLLVGSRRVVLVGERVGGRPTTALVPLPAPVAAALGAKRNPGGRKRRAA